MSSDPAIDVSGDEFSLDDMLEGIGVKQEGKEVGYETPEEKLYREWTEGKHPKLHTMCLYWLKHNLHVYKSLEERNWHVSKLSGPNRTKVEYKELGRALLEYYFRMTQLPRFEGEDAIRRGQAVDMVKFLDMVTQEPLVKKLLDDPKLLI